MNQTGSTTSTTQTEVPSSSSSGAGARQTAGPERPALSLRLRLALLVAIVVALVIVIEGYLEFRLFERRGQEDLMRSASATAQALADDIELRGASATPAEIHAVLHEFLAATPTVRDIAAFTVDGSGLRLVARTSTGTPDDILPAARLAIERREPTWTGTGRLRAVGVPILREGRVAGAVTVITSFASLEQLSALGREITLLFAVPAIVLLTLLVDLLARRLVYRPIAAIRRTMERAGGGEVGARAPVGRRDEMGAVAEGLNEMLVRLERFQADLQARVEEATGELRQKNAELVENYHRVLRLREALARAEQLAALGQMAANMAHQIGTPLNLISGYVQLMIEEAGAAGASAQRLQTIEAQIRKVGVVVRAMLDYARRPALRRELLDPGALIEQVCEISRPALRAANVELQLASEEGLPRLSADSVQLELALLNLISNALDAMPSGGRLRIAARRSAHGIRITVSDTGNGIPADVLPRVFEPWFTTKPPGSGTGLGLSITREVVTSHGGTIGVRSEAAAGTTFDIELPAEEAGAAVAAGGAAARAAGIVEEAARRPTDSLQGLETRPGSIEQP